ncbi:MAG: YfcC family protein [Bacteroidota bacterium]
MLKKIPHTYVIIFSFIVFAAILTWFVPGGEFQREVVEINGQEREIIIRDSFSYVERNAQTWEILAAFYEGFVDKSDIIVFILIIGGAFWIMNESKSIDVGIQAFVKFTERLEHNRVIKKLGVNNIVITLIMLVFSFFGATFGMSEETIAFIIIFVPLSIRMGYDSIIGVAMCFVGAGLGFAGALFNPFTIGIAQGLSDIPLFSGLEYRIFCWIVINIVGITFVLLYANRIRSNPTKSIVYSDDAEWRKRNESGIEVTHYHTPKCAWIVYGLLASLMVFLSFDYTESTLKIGNGEFTFYFIPLLTAIFIISSALALRKSVHFFILNLLFFTIFFLVVGVMGYGWYIMEIATLFFGMGLASGLSMGYGANKITNLFISGVKDIMTAALVVGLAGGILFILEQGRVIDTILYSISSGMEGFGKVASVGIMYGIQTLINIIIPSGSAKAALTMPIMSQFSDLIGISRQATVMAFQFGDGFTNMITPTSPVLFGVLGVAKIPFDKWVRWIGPLIIILITLGFLLLIPTVTMELSGF